MTTKYDIIDLHRQHPDWTANRVARELACCSGYVRATAKREGFQFPSAARERKNAWKLGRLALHLNLSEDDLRIAARGARRAAA